MADELLDVLFFLTSAGHDAFSGDVEICFRLGEGKEAPKVGETRSVLVTEYSGFDNYAETIA